VSEDDARAESGVVKKKRAVNHKEHRELKEGKAVTELGSDTHWVRQHQRANLILVFFAFLVVNGLLFQG
jgi:hypothetical protein